MQFWISKFEEYINKILKLDEETACALKKLENKVIAFEFINTKIKLFIIPSDNGLCIYSEYSKKPDVLIKSLPASFLKTIILSKTQIQDFPIDMQIVGDITLAQDFQKIMSNLELDIEEPLSSFLGDSLAFQAGRFIRRAGKFSFLTLETLMLDISEYLRFEVEMLPDELLVDEFNKEVDFLRNEIELTSKRVERLSHFLEINN